MSNKSSTNPSAKLRIAWIERQLAISGTFRINDGCEALGASRAQISADMTTLAALNPAAIYYDRHGKTYRWKPRAKVKTTLPAFIGSVNVTDETGEQRTIS